MEELGNQMEVIIGTLDAGVPHVSAEVWEFGVDTDAGGDPPVEIANSEMMPEVVRSGSVAIPLSKACSFPDSAKCHTDS